MTPGRFLRSLILTFVGLALTAASLTILFLGMRDVMEVGGACASGGPYEVAVPCPDTAWTIPVSVFTGLIGLGMYAAGVWRLPGPRWLVLAWPALFLSLGWNFWEYGLDPPGPSTGTEMGFIVCGVVFVLMGGIPLLVALGSRTVRRTLLWGGPPDDDDRPDPDRQKKLKLRDAYVQIKDLRDSVARTGAATAAAAAAADENPRYTPPPPRPTSASASAPSSGDASEAEDLADALERLAALRRRGDLTDAEFQAAKAKLIDEEATP